MKHKEALNNEIFSVITKASVNLKLHSYVIGGYVRDYLLKRGLKKDIDIDKLKRGEYKIEDIQYKKTNKLILGEYKGEEVELKDGRYGMYVNYKNKNYSLKGFFLYFLFLF